MEGPRFGFASGNDVDICRLCLSTERTLSSVMEVRWAYDVVTDTHGDAGWSGAQVCWECRALLVRLHRFRMQAIKAALLLESADLGVRSLSGLCLSRLGVTVHAEGEPETSPAGASLACPEPVSPPLDMEISIDVQIQKPLEEIVEFKEEPAEVEEGDVWADAALPELPAGGPASPAARTGVKRVRRRRKGKPAPAEGEGLEDLEELCESAWESSGDVQRKRAARLASARFNVRPYSCRPCALGFSSERARAAHAHEMHSESAEALPCDICGCRPADASLLAAHRASHRLLRCRRCRFATASAKNMRRHAAAHSRTEQRQAISCDVCGKQFMNKQHFYVHYKTHTSKQTYECEHCARVYRTRTQMFRHLRSHRMRFLCDICGKMFSDQTYLNCHYMAHAGASARRFECPQCNRRYINKFKLLVHMRFHTGEKPYRCAICEDRSFREKAQLTSHNRKYHPEHAVNVTKKKRTFERTKSAFVNERFIEPKEASPSTEDKIDDPNRKSLKVKTENSSKIKRVEYVCNFCGKKFKDKWRLKFHLAVHSDERPYKCDECDLTFKYQSGLWTHKLLHKGEKPHQCTICGSQFTQKGNLTAHLKIHTGEKPFECNVCGNKFRMWRNLRNHLKTHASIDVSKKIISCQ